MKTLMKVVLCILLLAGIAYAGTLTYTTAEIQTLLDLVNDIDATATEIDTPLDGASVTLTEFQELETIGATTLSANQWALLGGVAETLGSAELNLLDGETDLATQAELNAVAALVDTDDEIIAIINASPGTQIGVSAGGMGAGTFTDHAVLLGSGTGAVTAITVGATKEVLKGATGADAAFAVDRDFATQNHTSTGNITEAHIIASKWQTNNGASAEVDLTLPALSYTVGFVFIVEDAFISEINPPSGELFDHDGTDLDANDCIDTSIVIGDKIAFTRILLADGSTWRWSTDTIRGVHVDTGASD